MKVWLDGRLLDEVDARVSIADRGLTVGDGVFETLRTYGRRPFAVDAHLARLARSAEAMGIALPPPASLRDAIDAVVAARDLPECRVRVTVTAGEGPAGTVRGGGPATVLVTAGPLPRHPATATVVVCPWTRNPDDPLAGVKSTSYGGNVRALAWARARGADEAIFLTTHGDVCEGTGSNLFVEVDGALVTPPLSSGCLAGVTRALVLAACADRGIPVHERDVPAAALASATAAFLTSTTREVQPISRIDGRGLVEGPVTTRLAAALPRGGA